MNVALSTSLANLTAAENKLQQISSTTTVGEEKIFKNQL